MPVERFDGAAGIIVVIDFNEAEAAWLSREAVANQRNVGRRHASLSEPVRDVFFSSLKRQIAHIQFFHQRTPRKPVTTYSTGISQQRLDHSVGSPNETNAGYSGRQVFTSQRASSAHREQSVNKKMSATAGDGSAPRPACLVVGCAVLCVIACQA
jgi:hypothetical protein